MNIINWGILGTGRIAGEFAKGLAELPKARLLAVGSRAPDTAAAFAERYAFERAYASYDALLADSEVDVIYVATPHPYHHQNTLACLEHGKAVLCEKPLAINAQQAGEMVQSARARGLFLMEAMWTRAQPVTRQVRQWLDEQRIGDVRMLTADFGFRTSWNPQGRLLNPALGGGATLDVGVYTLAVASFVFGGEPEELHAAAHLGETGVDEQTAMLLRYAGGELALLSCAVRTSTPQMATIFGTQGSIEIPDFWHPTGATLRVNGEDAVEASGEVGYRYEAAEVMACLRAGQTESALIGLDESLAIARSMDRVRAAIGLRYPME